MSLCCYWSEGYRRTCVLKAMAYILLIGTLFNLPMRAPVNFDCFVYFSFSLFCFTLIIPNGILHPKSQFGPLTHFIMWIKSTNDHHFCVATLLILWGTLDHCIHPVCKLVTHTAHSEPTESAHTHYPWAMGTPLLQHPRRSERLGKYTSSIDDGMGEQCPRTILPTFFLLVGDKPHPRP